MCQREISLKEKLKNIKEGEGKIVFNKEDNLWNSKYFRIPSLKHLEKDVLLAFTDIRYNGPEDHAYIDIALGKSLDGGKTWNYSIAMKNDRKNEKFSRVMDSTILVTKTGRIILMAASFNTDGNWAMKTDKRREDWSLQMVYSDDFGLTWSEKIDLSSGERAIKNTPKNLIAFLGGVGSGITTEDGTLVMPAQISLREGDENKYYSLIIYSKDNGETWTMGNKVPLENTSENMVIELDGALIMSARYDYSGYRASFISKDLGETWEIYAPLHGKIKTGKGAGCQGSFIKAKSLEGHRIGLISAPKNLKGEYTRDNIALYFIDFDSKEKEVLELCIPYPYDGNSQGGGYSCLSFKDGNLSILYEANGNIEYKDLSNYFSLI